MGWEQKVAKGAKMGLATIMLASIDVAEVHWALGKVGTGFHFEVGCTRAADADNLRVSLSKSSRRDSSRSMEQ